MVGVRKKPITYFTADYISQVWRHVLGYDCYDVFNNRLIALFAQNISLK